ncbi:hypothetical protein A9G25_03805 [Gilliamella sp. Bif1-4]|nr:hypothetical protein A9G25_03805 [Gilliamella apicola]
MIFNTIRTKANAREVNNCTLRGERLEKSNFIAGTYLFKAQDLIISKYDSADTIVGGGKYEMHA